MAEVAFFLACELAHALVKPVPPFALKLTSSGPIKWTTHKDWTRDSNELLIQ